MDSKAESESEIRTIRDLIDHRAQTEPESVFLISPETGRSLSFRGLQEQAWMIAAELRELGLERGDKVAFLMDNGLFTAQLFLGTIYGGFVSVPLNVRAGVAQLSYALDHCDAKVVFVEEQYSGLLKEVMAEVKRPLRIVPTHVDGPATADEAAPLAAPLNAPKPDDIALLMYTSGSTGQPKAAMHSHRTLLAHGRNSICSHQLTAADRSLLVLPLYHINAECVTLIPTLLSGGSVIVPHRFSVSQFWDWLDEYRCTWSAVVPTIISQLLDWKDPRAESREAAFKRIRFLRSSSAPLSPSLHQEFLDKFPLLLIQAMGSTEGGNIFSNPLPPGENKIGSPGLAWGFETRIINREGAAVPKGEPGEVLLRGPALTQGYYKDPAGTAAAIDPEGWFHTGDLAYQDKDGYFFVVGRSKELIIKGGVNIAPKQIDEVLESYPAVLEAAAVGVPDRYVGEDLVAFVVLRSGMTGNERELLSFCERRLGPFKTPTRIHFVADLPKGPSGKVQRLKLQEKAAQPAAALESLGSEATVRGNGAAPSVPERTTPTPIEQTIAATWAELLKQPQVDMHSNFFSLGGHSLLAIQCVSRLREKLPVNLSLSDFFEHPTVAGQAALIRHRLRPTGGNGEPDVDWEKALLQQLSSPATEAPIPRRDRSQPCPLSPIQERVWFMEQLNSRVPVYNESEAVRLKGKLDVDVMERALNAIVARHEILRSTIQATGEQPVVVAHESWPLNLKRIDLRSLSENEREAEVERLLIDEPRRPYHLESEPGIRAVLIQLDSEDHVFILMMHHIICDWSSEGVFWRELSALYRTLLRGEPPALPPLPIQHGDYAVWQKKQMEEGAFTEDLAYWEQNLHGAPALLELPTDRPRPGVNSFEGARKRFRIGSTLVQSLRDCSRREKISLFTFFTAALDALLYRYTGSEDILIGIPLADRDRPEVESMIGFLLHTHVLRTRVTGEMNFRELLARVQKTVLDLYSHRSPPFDQVVTKVRPERNLSYSPLFQVMINWRDRDQQLSFIGMDGLAVESLMAETRTSKFDLTLMLTDDEDAIWLEMEYSTALFDDARIERMVAHYQTLLEAVAADPERRLAELPLLTEGERRQIVVEWNQTHEDFPANQLVHHLFEEQVRVTPDATAVVFDGKSLTYEQLNRRANQLARRLEKLGVGPDEVVAVCLERSFDLIVSLLAILKSGGAYLPVDPALPSERQALMLDDAHPAVLITQQSLQAKLPSVTAPVFVLDAERAGLESESGENVRGSVTEKNLAYVIYTSGSTGVPKGVEIPHQALTNFLLSMQKRPGLTAQDVLVAVTTFSFDIAGLEIFLPLLTGAKLIFLSRADAADGVRLLHQLKSNNATVLQATPSTWRMLLDAKWGGNPELKMLCGGEAMPPDLAEQLLAQGGELWNMYGPTETTIWSSAARVTRADASINIGQPIANTQLYILDPHLQPVPLGVTGELHIGGRGLARGYRNRPELTAERFIPDPFSDVPGARLYKTGDVAKLGEDGKIELLGRLDHQVKIRGFRIELGEIEAILSTHPNLLNAVVVAREDTPGDKRLVAYATAKNGEPPKASELRALLQNKLPEYMVPSAFVNLERFPLTPNGKVDRKALPKPDFEAAADKGNFIAPGTPTEMVLAEIWCDVLGRKQVGVHDNFFDLGGHSLLMVQVQTRACEKLKTDVSIVEMFQYPTISALARHLGQPSAGSDRLQKVQERSRRRKEVLGRQRQLKESV
jgi:amino acid adenylation domain-containing protein